MPDPPKLPPFPDELVAEHRKGDVVRFLRWLGLPSRVRAAHLKRWADYLGLELTAADYDAVRAP